MKISTKQPLLSRLMLVLLALLPLLSACKKETDTQKSIREHEEAYKVIDDQLIQDYFARHNITSKDYTRLESGVYLINLEEGTGPTIASNRTVQVKYIGQFITSAREDVVFDKSYGNRTLCECIEVVVDQSPVVKGWHEAIKTMKKDSRKRVFIPSYMAYGPGGFGASIPADEPLQFDMLISDVK